MKLIRFKKVQFIFLINGGLKSIGMFSVYSIFKVLNLDIKCLINKIFNGLYIDNCIEL